MSARGEIDKKNLSKIKEIIKEYPNILLNGYINSMPKQTSYTKVVYVRYVCNFLNYIKDELNMNIFDNKIYNNIKPMHIDAYMEFIRCTEDGKEKSGMYRAAQLAAIKKFFKFLKKNEIINNNPCLDVETPKDNSEHKITTLSESDISKIMDNIENGVGSHEAVAKQKKWKTRDKAIVLLGITTGLRMSAIIGIDINDIDLKNKTISVVEKGDKRRTVYIGKNTAKALEDWLYDRSMIVTNKKEKAVFISQKNTRIAPRTMEYIMKRVTYGIRKNITPHKMRATCATRLYEETGDIYLVQQQLGHKNIENTKRYAEVSDKRRKEAANILDSLY